MKTEILEIIDDLRKYAAQQEMTHGPLLDSLYVRVNALPDTDREDAERFRKMERLLRAKDARVRFYTMERCDLFYEDQTIEGAHVTRPTLAECLDVIP